jgi:hypothetical protein
MAALLRALLVCKEVTALTTADEATFRSRLGKPLAHQMLAILASQNGGVLGVASVE